MSIILNWIISTSYSYFTDLGSISNTISEKALSKGAKTLGKSFLSSLGRNDDQLEKIKQKPHLAMECANLRRCATAQLRMLAFLFEKTRTR